MLKLTYKGYYQQDNNPNNIRVLILDKDNRKMIIPIKKVL